MNTTPNSAFAALPPKLCRFGVTGQCGRQIFLAVALVGALAATMARAQTDSGLYRPLTLAAAEPAAGGGGAAEPAAGGSGGAESEAELAKKLQNPIANLISVPFQNNFDFGAGPNGDGFQYLLRVQPVIPVSLSEDWNVISRTILPTIYQQNYIRKTSQFGLGDTLQSFFFSPQALWHGWTWGAGPVFQLPTATDNLLGQGKWGAGPTAVVLKQTHGWTFGALANQVWSFAGWGPNDVSYTFLQPFLAYTLKSHTTFALNSESTYDWEHAQWTVPLNMTVKQVLKIGTLPLQLEFGPRYYVQRPINGPDWGLRFTITFLLPNK
jgi:hypothetical protein